jgi:hypothetical protein
MNAQACLDNGFATKMDVESGTDALLRPGIYDNVPATILAAQAKEDWVCAASRDLPIAKKDTWDGPAAAERMLDAAGFNGDSPDPAKAKAGFLAYDASEPKLKGSYKLPFADVIDGKLEAVDTGWVAAEQRLEGTDIPQPVKDAAQSVIESYKKKSGADDGKSNNSATVIARMRTRMAALYAEV